MNMTVETKKWIAAHRKEIIVTSAVAGTTIALVLGVKNKNLLENLFIKNRNSINPCTAQETVAHITENYSRKELIDKPLTHVNGHLRNLPYGWKASATQKALALQNGCLLDEGVTWINDYTRRSA